MYKIGIDVGGTNTDAVILDHQLNLIHSVKVQQPMIFKQGLPVP